MKNNFFYMAVAVILFAACSSNQQKHLQTLRVSDNQRFLVTADGKPFMWLGCTAWLIHKLDREQTEQYLENRRQLGYNVIQISTLHHFRVESYGHKAVADGDPSRPIVTEGNDPNDSLQYDYWDHLDYQIDLATAKGLYVAIVPVWGTNVTGGYMSREQAEIYVKFLAERHGTRSNIIWLNGGDIFGSDSTETWNIMGKTLQEHTTNQLITFHPIGRTRSSEWFHNEPWLDFNMFQSGHRTYEQDPNGIGQDTWRYIEMDYNLKPVKPTIDGEPSYEHIPHGLHDWHLDRNVHLRPANYTQDLAQPFWEADDLRRYAYWSVFAGGFGFTYGHNSLMQMLMPTDRIPGAFSATIMWDDALNAEGGSQMQYLKKLMLSRPFLERIPDNSLVAHQGERYDHIQGTRGETYAFLYTYRGGEIKVNMGKIKGKSVKASWFNPRNGEITKIGKVKNDGVATFITPVSEPQDGNDWVLVLDTV